MADAPATKAEVVVGIGASAGGIEPLCSLLSGLKPDLPAAVLVVVHLHASAPSVLDRILDRCCELPVAFARDQEELHPGRVYVAPADWHMVVAEGQVRLDHGPTVNAVRPSVDVLFRSLADQYGPRALAVVLSGSRDDGAAGVHAIKAAGGRGIVQDPGEAVFPGMPAAALELGPADQVALAADIAELIDGAVRGPADPQDPVDPLDPLDPAPAPISGGFGEVEPWIEGGGEVGASVGRSGDPAHPEGRPSELACPECGGILWEQPDPPPTFECRVGHSYSPASLVARHSQKLEEALWSAVVALEERADLFERVSGRLSQSGGSGARLRYEQGAAAARHDAGVLKSLLLGLDNPPDPNEEQ
jgi:two-component system chemotaxis response regulator CheB